MLVMKFGGSSVATAENINRVKDIILEKSQNEPVIAVVSALGGVTSDLILCSQFAKNGDDTYIKYLQSIEKRHLALTKDLIAVAHQSQTLSRVKLLINELEDILRGVYLIHELSKRTNDRILVYGELLSSIIIADYLQQSRQKTALANPTKFIITDNQFGKANVKFDITLEKVAEYFKANLPVTICPGFIAANEDGEVTTLGRGGSDYTASIIAAGVSAPKLEIWTDVSGMMTANPKLVSSAYAIKEITYDEAMELSHFGAKVIYPPTIQPLLEKNIPIHIKNTFSPEDYGTLISYEGRANGNLIKGISCIENIALLNLSGSGMVGIPNFSNRLFSALSKAQVNVIMITQASSEHSICVGIDIADVQPAQLSVNEEFKYELNTKQVNPLEVEQDLSIIALVGSNMKEQVGVSGHMFNTLGQNGVNVKAIAQGSSEKNISAVIQTHDVKKALNTLHESFFLSEKKVLNLFIVGIGNVGKALINQLAAQQKYLMTDHHIELRVVAVANSRHMLFKERGIDLKSWEKVFETEAESMEMPHFIQKMSNLNLRNSIFIDNTANETIASYYEDIIKESISVVTPNKIACTQSIEKYKSLKQAALKYKAKFLFETNVGAGLPVINTLNDLIKSGDEVQKIEAVLSGSLNFIFNNYHPGVKFADIVRQAGDEGYTEPDPRIDLSGVDVKRKILILIRETGRAMEIDAIKTKPFIPAQCMNAPSVASFFEEIEKADDVFQKLVNESEEKDCKLKYVATYDKGEAETGLRLIAPGHPFYNLEGKDNIVLFTTKRYNEQPLVIKGAGAGAEVTASGIFGDIMRIANS